jgi:hypothetical protein
VCVADVSDQRGGQAAAVVECAVVHIHINILLAAATLAAVVVA